MGAEWALAVKTLKVVAATVFHFSPESSSAPESQQTITAHTFPIYWMVTQRETEINIDHSYNALNRGHLGFQNRFF